MTPNGRMYYIPRPVKRPVLATAGGTRCGLRSRPMNNRSGVTKRLMGTVFLGSCVLAWIAYIVTPLSSAAAAPETHWPAQMAAASGPNSAHQVSFQTIAMGSRSGVRQPLQIVLRTQDEWAALWQKHIAGEINSQPLASIDFNKDLVAAVFLGEKATGGYDVEIVRIERSGTALVIDYREKAPPTGGIVTQALTQPFHIVKVLAASNLTASFRRAS